MKIIKFIISTLLALSLIFCAGIFIFFQTFDTDQYLSPITKKASLALGRPVSIGHLGLGLSSQGITLDAGPLIVADDLDFTTQPFIKIDRIRVSLDLKSLVLRREFHITGILWQSPQIHFIRSQEGNINVHSILQKGTHPDLKRSEGEGSQIKRDFSPITSSLTKVPHKVIMENLNIKIQDASISFIDQSQSMPLDIWLKGINANLNNFSLSRPFLLSFDTSPLLLKGVSPGTQDSPVLKDITGNVQLNLAHLDMGPGGITANGQISTTGGVIKSFNIVQSLLSRTLGVFGDFDAAINNLFNGQLKDALGAEDTIIEKAQTKFSFHDKTIFVDDFLIQTNIFDLTAQGSVDQGLNVDMQTMLHLNNDVSTALVNELAGLKILCDDSQRIAIDASLEGVIPHLKYKPNKDFRKKSRKFLMKEGASILGILFK